MTTKNKIILVLGGARSGKSAFAEQMALESTAAPIYLATGRAWDDEMTSRIDKHKARRETNWQSFEEPLEVSQFVRNKSTGYDTLLLDCLTLWVTNLMLEERAIEPAFQDLLSTITSFQGTIIFVSNEIGMGIVPENKMAREFRDYIGDLHKRIADIANEVYLVVAGIPMTVKKSD
jgi:adenosylcobinamide kinase / adenosylcobinamide-phosphate guanylyltransferase